MMIRPSNLALPACSACELEADEIGCSLLREECLSLVEWIDYHVGQEVEEFRATKKVAWLLRSHSGERD